MRDFLKLDSEKFVSKIEQRAETFWSQQEISTLRNHVVDSSNLAEGKIFSLKGPKSLKNMIRYCILSWYAPEEIKWYLRLDLEEEAKSFSLEDQFLVSQFLSSKAEMLCFLLDTTLWHSRDFEGNIFNWDNIKNLGLRLINISVKVKRPQRKRGYHDHGSRVENHRWLPKFDWSFIQEQNKLEQERENQKFTISLATGMIT